MLQKPVHKITVIESGKLFPSIIFTSTGCIIWQFQT